MGYSDEISVTEPRARKPHRCVWCGENIPVGEKHRKDVSKHLGEFQSLRLHLDCVFPCFEESSKFDPEEGFEPYAHLRGSRDERP